MFVIPAAGRTVRDPISRKALPPEGREVPESTHWIRRLAAGDVTLFVAPAVGPAPVIAAPDLEEPMSVTDPRYPLDF